MSEFTTTRAELRRAIASELQMPFARRFPAGFSTLDSTSSSTKIVDAALRQKDKFWDGDWFYGITTGDISLIRAFNAQERTAHLETERSGTDTETFEIHSIWNADEIHKAINRSLQMCQRVFHQTVVDESLVYQEDTLTYTISGLSIRPWVLNKVFIERPNTVYQGTASAGGASTITLQSVPSGINTNWKISIYAGTGKGQSRNYASAAGLIVTVSSAWTTNPDDTSKYAIWDPTDEQYHWEPVYALSQDAKEFPDSLRFRSRFTSSHGMRIRLEYLAYPTALSADADTTGVPKEYILPMACSILHGQRLSSTRADRDMHFAEQERYKDQADKFLIRNAPHRPDTLIPVEGGVEFTDTENPLGWWRG